MVHHSFLTSDKNLTTDTDPQFQALTARKLPVQWVDLKPDRRDPAVRNARGLLLPVAEVSALERDPDVFSSSERAQTQVHDAVNSDDTCPK